MKLALTIAGAVALTVAPGFCADQKGKAEPEPKTAPKAAREPAPRNPGRAGAGGGRRGGPGINNPLNPVQRLFQMTPEQRERVLEQLPPERQTQLRQQLERFDNLKPAEKERLARQYQSLAALPPATQRIVNQGIMGMNHLQDDRKVPVFRELRSLVNMSDEDRTARLASEEFKKKYTAQEQKILTDLSTNLPPDYPIFDRR